MYQCKLFPGVAATQMPTAVAMDPRWIIPGVSPLMPDPWHPQSIQDAVFNRLCVKLPVPVDRAFYRKLRSFARSFFHKHFSPVPVEKLSLYPDMFLSWLDSRDYPQNRKNELRKLWLDIRQCKLLRRDWRCKAFVKHESYEAPKWPRTIVSRSDAYKCFSGPWFALIEESTYTSPYFVKHVPVASRAAFIQRLAEHGLHRYFGSDYSSFELHAHARMQRAVELQFYDYMLRNVRRLSNECDLFLTTHRKVATSLQRLDNKYATFKIPACRMSGETCTSLGNGITNLILSHFITSLVGSKVIDGVVEGDDGLFVIRGERVPDESFFKSCGCLVKLQSTTDLSEAGFCSMQFAETTKGRVMLRDFREKCVKFGWTTSPSALTSTRARAGLLAAAGYSLAAENGSCPVLWKLAQCVLRQTTGIQPRVEGDGYHHFTTNVCVQEPTIEVRSVYSNLFNCDVVTQLALENEIERFGLAGPLMRSACYTPERAKMADLVVFRRAGVLVTSACQRPV